MEILRRDGSYEQLKSIGQQLSTLFSTALKQAGIAHRIVGDSTLFDVVFTDQDVFDYRSHANGDAARNATFNDVLREHGVLKSPTKLYPSLAVSEQDLALTENAIDAAVKALLS